MALTASGHLTDNLAWRRAAPALAGLLFAGGFLYMAQQSRLARHYLLAATSALLGVLLVWPEIDGAYANLRVWAIVMALIIDLDRPTMTLFNMNQQLMLELENRMDGKANHAPVNSIP